jgi:hypothetical protein
MPLNFQGPFALRVFYQTAVGSFDDHRLNYNVDVVANAGNQGLDFDQYTIRRRNGGEIALHTAVEAWLAAIAPLYRTDTDFGPVELWKVTVTDLGGGVFSVDETFWAAYTPTANAGTSGNAIQISSQVIITLRTQEGGIMRLDFLDTAIAPGIEQSFPTAVPAVNTIVATLVTDDGFILAKDTSYPIVGKRFFPGTNEALFKKRFRASTQ